MRFARLVVPAALLIVGSGLCLAQVTTNETRIAGVQTLGPVPGQIPLKPQDPIQQAKPLEPKGFPAPDQKGNRLPSPQKLLKEIEFKGNKFHQIGRKFLLTEGAEMVYKGYRIFAQEIEGDTNSNIFTATGDVKIIGEDSIVRGDTVIINFEKRTYNAINAEAQIPPSLSNNQARGDLYVFGKQSFGSQAKYEAYDSTVTSCNLPEPHFRIDSKRTTVEPGKQAVFRDVVIRLFDKPILRLPYLWIPLGDRSYKYLPQVGQTPDEGYFIKNRYGFPLHGEDIGAVRLDYMEKLGTGIGADYLYRNRAMNGVLRGYTIMGNQTTSTYNLQHEQRFGLGTLTLDQDYQQNNYLTAPGSTIVNTRAQFMFKPKKNDRTTLGFVNQSSTTDAFQSENRSITLTDFRSLGNFQTNLDLAYAKASNSYGTTQSGRETVDVRFRGNQDLKKATATLEYQRTIPIGDIQNFFAGSDRTPVVTLASDSGRLLGSQDKSFPLPFRTEVSIGEYLDPVQKSRITRDSFDLNFNRRTQDKGNWKFDFNGRFRQTLYSDDTAQFVLNSGTALTYQLGKTFSTSLRYSYLRPYGYSPLSIDRSGTTNTTTLDVSSKPSKEVSLGLQTGYDIERLSNRDIPWQQVGVRAEYALNNSFSFRSLSTYDTFQQSWSNVRLDATWRFADANIALGARYDGISHTWSNANAYLDGLEYGKTRFAAILSYNGFTERFDSQQYNLIYDLHDAEAVLTVSDFGTGFRSGREITFLIRLKIFPIDTNFGVGRRGQPLGTGSGRDF